MATTPAIPIPQQPPQQAPSVAANVAPIAAAAQSLGPQPGVSAAQIGGAPAAQPEQSSKKRIVASVLGAAAGFAPLVQQINQKHSKDQAMRNQHIIDTVWQSHNSETQARNRVQQLSQIVQDTDRHIKEAQSLPDDDPMKMQKVAYLTTIHAQVVGEIKQQAQLIQQNQGALSALLGDPKNRKILSKAVGYDEKQANSPERQQLIAAIQKSIPGTSPQEAQFSAQFAQGQSQGSPGLDPRVQAEVIKAAGTQAAIGGREDVAQTRGAAQVEAAEIRGKGSAKGKTGVLFDQGVPYAWTSPEGKQYTASSQDIPPEGKRALADANQAYGKYAALKQQGSAGAAQRAHVMYLNYLLHSQGVDEKGAALPGSMQTDTGKTVGTANAPNVRPTGVERGRADLATSAKEQLDDIKSILGRRGDLFGPGKGQITSLTQFIGSQDPDVQALVAAARTSADHLAGVFGGRSEAALSGIFDVLYRNRTNVPAALAGIDQFYKAADKIQKKGIVHTVGSSTEINKPPDGATHTGMGSDGKRHYTDAAGKDLGVAE